MKKLLFTMVIGLQVLFLAGMSVSYYVMDDIGQIVKLETEPIDPQDIFYGDYITLRYEVEQIPEKAWEGDINADRERNKKVYVVVKKDDEGIYHVTSASFSRMEAGHNEAVLTGKYVYYDDYQKTHYVEYGISRYFIEDNTGENYEQRQNMVVTVAIAPWGQKRILQVE